MLRMAHLDVYADARRDLQHTALDDFCAVVIGVRHNMKRGDTRGIANAVLDQHVLHRHVVVVGAARHLNIGMVAPRHHVASEGRGGEPVGRDI